MNPTANPSTPTLSSADELAHRWAQLRDDEPKLRIRDAALRLGVSEAHLLETEIGSGVRRLTGDLKELFAGLAGLGRCMALTRNEHAVHERKGEYEKISFSGHGGLVLGPDIDLRTFPSKWKVAYAVVDEQVSPPRRSLQFFDKSGIAAHKVYLQGEDAVEAFEELVSRHAEVGADGLTEFEAPAPPKAERPDADIDGDGFRAAWLAMKDTHDFFIVCHKFGVTRTQALRLAPEAHAIQIENDALRRALEGARDEEFPIMVFVSSGGVIQIHTGEVERLMEYGEWFNVLDPHFNLHVRESAIASSWIVRKPTEDGVVTSLELFDAEGQNILLMFGARKPGQPERAEWTALMSVLQG